MKKKDLIMDMDEKQSYYNYSWRGGRYKSV